jgi:hypothetical protein
MLLLVCACATTQQKGEVLQQTWRGRKVNDLIAKLGPPTRITDDGHGGKIYAYTTTKTFHTGGQGGYYAGPVYVLPSPEESHTLSQHKRFWVNDQGVIYRVEYQKTQREDD